MKKWILTGFYLLVLYFTAYTQTNPPEKCPANFGGPAFVHTKYEFENRYYQSLMEFCLDTVKKNLFKGTLKVDGNLHMRGIFALNSDYNFSPDKNHESILYDVADTTIRLQAHFNGYYSLTPGSGSFSIAGKKYPVRISDEFGIWFRVGTDTIDNQLLIEHFKYLSENGTKDATTELVTGYQNYAMWYKVIYSKDYKPAPSAPQVSLPDPTVVQNNQNLEYEKLSRLLDLTLAEAKEAVVPNAYVSEVLSADINHIAYFSKTLYPARYKWDKYTISVFVPKQYSSQFRYLAERSYTLNGQQIKEPMSGMIDPIDFNNGVYCFTQALYLPEKTDADGGKIDIKLWYATNCPLFPVRVMIRRLSY
ncbi:MAG: hypothetical protein K1X92_06550 [Bacteroidia bacterium]|nr:hypothetical protein [Bacteroidia bacterium]